MTAVRLVLAVLTVLSGILPGAFVRYADQIAAAFSMTGLPVFRF